jgi:hypothetical protein
MEGDEDAQELALYRLCDRAPWNGRRGALGDAEGRHIAEANIGLDSYASQAIGSSRVSYLQRQKARI